MVRTILGVIAGVIAWVIVVTLLNFGLRYGLSGYAEAERSMAFTLPMMIGRLAESVVATLAAGALARVIAPTSRVAPIALGLLLLALFVPLHVSLWSYFPVWYHLTFLISLPVLVLVGASLMRRTPARV